MLKTALFDCAINDKCCRVDEGRGIRPLFLSPPRGIWQLKSPHLQEFAIQGKKKKKMLMPGKGKVEKKKRKEKKKLPLWQDLNSGHFLLRHKATKAFLKGLCEKFLLI